MSILGAQVYFDDSCLVTDIDICLEIDGFTFYRNVCGYKHDRKLSYLAETDGMETGFPWHGKEDEYSDTVDIRYDFESKKLKDFRTGLFHREEDDESFNSSL